MQKYDFIKKQYTAYTPPQNGHCDIMVHANVSVLRATISLSRRLLSISISKKTWPRIWKRKKPCARKLNR